MDKVIWQFFNELYDTVCNPNVNEAEIHDRGSKNSVVNRNEPLLILQATNFELIIKSWRSQLQKNQKQTFYGNDTNHQKLKSRKSHVASELNQVRQDAY